MAAFVEKRKPDFTGTIAAACTWPDRLHSPVCPEPRWQLGVDFGTSHTVAVVRAAGRPGAAAAGRRLAAAAVRGLRRAGRRAGRRPGRGAQRPARPGPLRAQPEAPHRRRHGAARRPRGAGGRPGRRRCWPGSPRSGTARSAPVPPAGHADLPGHLGGHPPPAARRRRRPGRPRRRCGWSPSRSPPPPTSPRCSAGTCRSGRSWWCTTSARARSTRAWWPARRPGSRCWRSTGATTSAASTSTRRSSTHLAKTYVERDPAAWARLDRPGDGGRIGGRKRQLWDDVRVAKERLSRSQSADLMVPLLDLDVHLTRDELERLAQPVLDADGRG